MKSRVAKPTTHIRHRSSTVQSGQDTDPVDDQKWDRLPGCAEAYCGGKAGCGSTPLDCVDVGFRRLMGYEDEPGLWMAPADGGECSEQDQLVPGPRGSGDHSRCAAPEAKQGFF
jgi:hypothetical protein